jgi:hypothetical protein
MSSLDRYTFQRCYEILIRCDEVSRHDRLVTLFNIRELEPLKRRVEEKNNLDERVSWCISYLSKTLVNGECALLIFLRVLADRYDSIDSRHGELISIIQIIKDAQVQTRSDLFDKPTSSSTLQAYDFPSIGKPLLRTKRNQSNINDTYNSPRGRLKGNYVHLRKLLEAGSWKEADLETSRILINISNRPQLRCLQEVDIKSLPPQELQCIDRLWSNYSEGRFGLVSKVLIIKQNNIKVNDWDCIFAFSQNVGWLIGFNFLRHSELNFSLEAPPGHLPSLYPIDEFCDPKIWKASLRTFLPLIVEVFTENSSYQL